MDKEREAVLIFMKRLGNRCQDLNFETDACAFSIGDQQCLFSADEFSSEDNFRSHNAFSLGWNVTAATISDVFAAGGIPLFYGHAVTIQRDWDQHYLGRFSEGIAGCLKVSGGDFLGGDIGMADKWSYTGIVIGRKLTDLSRRGAHAGDSIYMTGHVGSGNLEAALKLYTDIKLMKPLLNLVEVKFPVRIKEAAIVRKFASACMDTSDGLFRAMNDLCRISRTGFRIDHVRYDHYGKNACSLLGKPVEILFLGECGEYELVFTIPPDREVEFLSEANGQHLDIFRLGTITGDEKLTLVKDSQVLDLTGYSILARNYPDVHQYIYDLVRYINDGTRRNNA